MESTAGDNGREFAGRGGAVERAVFFRHPRSSFEKGAGERRSGLPRRFAEKGGSADAMPAQLISKAADTGTATFPGKFWVARLLRKCLR
ncbi:MAG: hypothetical protein LBU32_09505 [Clostridiales bacterium]|nr:hypothetical protein [Clostridiales bacterium]